MRLHPSAAAETAAHVMLFPQAYKTEYIFVKCFDFSSSSSSNTGIIYFLEESGDMKIDGIQFF